MAETSNTLTLSMKYMFLLAVLYEPVRQATQHQVEMLSGVGGVGGLCNLGSPDDCDRLSGRTGQYCYFPGLIAGFTWFAIAWLALWIAPLVLGALRMASSTCVKPGQGSRGSGGEEAQQEPDGTADTSSLQMKWLVELWLAVECLWFFVPFGGFISDPFFRNDFGEVVSAIALAAAYPLSWHLSFVALPMSKVVLPALGVQSSFVVTFHKLLGWHTAGWGCVHAFGMLTYMVTGEHGLWWNFNLQATGEHLLNTLGLATLCLIIVHASVAAMRKQQWMQPYFKHTHRALAILVLLCATAHWWPFVFFLFPAATVHAVSTAGFVAEAWHRRPSQSSQGLALLTAFLGAVVALTVVWYFREKHMLSPGVGLISPFAFPPLALLASFASGTSAAILVLMAARKSDAPLLANEGGARA
mmetsp:Transcript_75161/g.140162  ORF Transcript_75161/g.140162 Transcript_75161/m.140162 type:complete len:414 (+) Transcript_75161:148-1389(+)